MAGITSTGLGSGIQVSQLVSQLVQAEGTPALTRLARQEADIQARISSLGNFKSALSAFRDSLSTLKSLSSFQKISANSGDATLFTASAEAGADLGSYRIEVKQLAQSHALASKQFTSAADVVGTGTLTIKFGATVYDSGTDTYTSFAQNADKGTLTLTIDSTNNTLTGIRDAINKANAGVTAAIINDGSGYRLVLNSTDSGAKNSLQVAVSGDSAGTDTDTDGLSALAFNSAATNLDQTQAAQDAKVAINGLDVLSSSNTVKDALKGVTLNLLQAQLGKQVGLTVSQNNADVSKGVDGFVKAYNELAKIVKSLAGYDAAKKQGGILQGDATLRGAMSQLRSEMSTMVQGLTGSVRALTDLGIRTQADGTLSLDSGKLNNALSSDRNAVAALFAVLGRPSDTAVTYVSSTSSTVTGDYALNVTQTATQGLLNGAAAASFVVDGNNDTFKIKVDGVQSGTLTLTQSAGYTGATLAAELQSRINGDSALKAAGAAVVVSYDSGANRFVFQSKSYGSASKVEITEVDTSSAATLGLAVAAGTDGVDVAGTIDGQTATGKAQELTGTGGNSDGLKVSVTGSTGYRGTVNFTRGLIEKLDKVLAGLLDSTGTISSKTQGLAKTLESINDKREELDRRMADLEERLLKKFNAMDSLVGRFQALGSRLTQQLATLPLNQQSNQ